MMVIFEFFAMWAAGSSRRCKRIVSELVVLEGGVLQAFFLMSLLEITVTATDIFRIMGTLIEVRIDFF
jgi:hypothetical protein